ncbi:AAA family ATPase [Micromonospora sp. BRA006-A]|nr:AAA family ATPase [Micromonospora sp. BRA006-A]
MGKTSLAAALGARAAANGVPVVWGRCPDVGQAPPFWLWSQVVRALLALPHTRAAGSASRLDGFAAGAPSGPGDGRGLDPTARFQVYEAVADLVHAAARERGLLVVLDDLHAADPDSLLLLRFLATALPVSRALVVATLRPYDDDPALVATVAELARGRGFGQVRLAGLDAAAVADLVRDRTGVAPPEPQVTRLVTRTGGNPFFLTELLRSRADAGADAELPPSIRDTVRLRLAGLPAATRRCLDLLQRRRTRPGPGGAGGGAGRHGRGGRRGPRTGLPGRAGGRDRAGRARVPPSADRRGHLRRAGPAAPGRAARPAGRRVRADRGHRTGGTGPPLRRGDRAGPRRGPPAVVAARRRRRHPPGRLRGRPGPPGTCRAPARPRRTGVAGRGAHRADRPVAPRVPAPDDSGRRQRRGRPGLRPGPRAADARRAGRGHPPRALGAR